MTLSPQMTVFSFTRILSFLEQASTLLTAMCTSYMVVTVTGKVVLTLISGVWADLRKIKVKRCLSELNFRLIYYR